MSVNAALTNVNTLNDGTSKISIGNVVGPPIAGGARMSDGNDVEISPDYLWLRSAFPLANEYFISITKNGYNSAVSAGQGIAIVPCFCL